MISQLPHYDLVTVNLHLKSPGLNNQDRDRLEGEVDSLSALVENVQGRIEAEKEVVMLGDFNLSPNAQGRCYYLGILKGIIRWMFL